MSQESTNSGDTTMDINMQEDVVDVYTAAQSAIDDWAKTPDSNNEDEMWELLILLQDTETGVRGDAIDVLKESHGETDERLSWSLFGDAVDTYVKERQSELRETASRVRQLNYRLVRSSEALDITNNGAGEFKIPEFEPRTEMVAVLLESMEIPRSSYVIQHEQLDSNMIRKVPYALIYLSQFNKTILVCDQSGEATFVVDGIYRPATKDAITETMGTRITKHSEDQWLEGIQVALQAAPRSEEDLVGMNSPSYYESHVVLLDLESWAAEANTTVEELHTGHLATPFTTASGEIITGITYLGRYGTAFGEVEFQRNVHGVVARRMLYKLRSLAGIEEEIPEEYTIMDADYFANAQNVRTDLQSAATVASCSIEELKAGRPTTFTAANGEQITLVTYLSRAGIALGIVKTSVESGSNRTKILDALCKIIGIEKKKIHCKIDANYCKNPTNIREDIISMEEEASNNNRGKINYNGGRGRFVAMNGEDVSVNTYLNRTGVELGMAKNRREASVGNTRALITSALYEIAGISEKKPHCAMDNAYFANPTNIREDLLSATIAANRDSIEKLPSSALVSLVAMNGEEISVSTLLNRAGVAEGFAEDQLEAQTIKKDVLNHLRAKLLAV